MSGATDVKVEELQKEVEELKSFLAAASDSNSDIDKTDMIDHEVNKKEISDFVQFAYDYNENEEGYIAFRSFGERNKEARPVTTWVPNDSNAAEELARLSQEAYDDGRSAFVIPMTMKKDGGKASDCVETSLIVIDIDSGDIKAKYQHIKEILGEPGLIVESGGVTSEGQNKLHIYYRLTEATSEVDNIAVMQKAIAVKSGADTAFGSPHQPLRLPGSLHSKKGTRPVSIIHEGGGDVDFTEFSDIVLDMPSISGDNVASLLAGAQDNRVSIDQIMTQVVRSGDDSDTNRHEQLSRMIGHQLNNVWDGRISADMAVENVLNFNASQIVPPREENYIMTEIDRLYKKRFAEHGAAREYVFEQTVEATQFYRFDDIYDDPEIKPDDMIDGVLEPEGFLLVSGPPKSMKSLYLQYMLEKVAMGENIGDIEVKSPRRIFWLQAELTKFALRDRMQMRSYTEEDKKRVGDNLSITDRFRHILDEDGVSKVVRMIKTAYPDPENPCEIIAIDPLANVFEGEENANEDMLKFLRDRIEQIRIEVNKDAGVIMVHHASKVTPSQIEEAPFSNGIRGASSLRGWYSGAIIIARLDDEKPYERNIWFETRNGEPPKPKTVLLERNGEFTHKDYTKKKATKKTTKKKSDKTDDQIVQFVSDIIYENAREGRTVTVADICSHGAETSGNSANWVKTQVTNMLKEGILKLNDGNQFGHQAQSGCYYVTDNVVELHKGFDSGVEGSTIVKDRIKATHWMNAAGKVIPQPPE